MIDVIEINSADGEVAQLLDRRSALDVSEHGRLRLESKWNETAKSSGFILKLTKLAQMIDALLERFDMAVKHGASAAAAHAMPGPMNIEPFLSRLFAATNPVPHRSIKNFRATASDGTQAALTEKLECLRDRHLEDSLSEMTNFNRSKGFDVQIRIESAQST